MTRLTRMKRRTLLLGGVVTAVVVSVPVAVTAWAAGGDNGPPVGSVLPAASVPGVVNAFARKANVADVHTIASDPAGRIGVFAGTSSGRAVIGFGSSEFFGGFAPIGQILRGEDVVVRSSAGGPAAGPATWMGVVGVTSQRVNRLQVTSADGKIHNVAVTASGFAYSASTPEEFPVKVTALSKGGAVLSSADIAAPSSVGP
ncbi:MAG TPA: hypothetical protein VFJ93_05310 [Gaiellaceae bacterium]|nr:hypothetical protein [Gaiellaceae bacterium]